MTISFSNSSPKIPKSDMLSPRFKDFYFCPKLCSKTNSRALISNMTMMLQNSSPKINESRIFGPKLKDFYFCTKLYYKTNSRTVISNMTQVAAKKYSNKAFLVPNWRIFIFALNFTTRQIQGRWFQIWHKLQPRNIQIRHFWSQIEGFLFLH